MSDYIKREDAIKAKPRWAHDGTNKGSKMTDEEMDGYNDALVEYSQNISSIPAADVEPVRHGHWVIDDEPYDENGGYCSVCMCDMPIFFADWRYQHLAMPRCPKCGAKMDEAAE